MKPHGWALENKRGQMIPATFSTDKDDAWARSFSYLYERFPWMKQYWKQWDESQTAAKKKGYRLIRVCLFEWIKP